MSTASSKTGEQVPPDQRDEASKTAQAALSAQQQAQDLSKAAADSSDPKERQKLLDQAREKEVEAESTGKTAKYLDSGAFQGLVAGGGIGVGTGAGLGTLTGALVGGTASLVTGGLGGGVGAGVGALHGPFVQTKDMANSAAKSVSNALPGQTGTDQQPKALEKAVREVHDQEMPSTTALVAMAKK